MAIRDLKIFIVDNSKVGWQRVSNLLEAVHNIEMTGSDADECEIVTAVEEMKPDVLILDIDRSAYTGIELLRQIRREYAFLDIIVITDASSSFFRRKCVEAGAKFFFDKATEFQKIPQAIEILRKRVRHSPN